MVALDFLRRLSRFLSFRKVVSGALLAAIMDFAHHHDGRILHAGHSHDMEGVDISDGDPGFAILLTLLAGLATTIGAAIASVPTLTTTVCSRFASACRLGSWRMCPSQRSWT